jgi:hypothetical protein
VAAKGIQELLGMSWLLEASGDGVSVQTSVSARSGVSVAMARILSSRRNGASSPAPPGPASPNAEPQVPGEAPLSFGVTVPMSMSTRLLGPCDDRATGGDLGGRVVEPFGRLFAYPRFAKTLVQLLTDQGRISVAAVHANQIDNDLLDLVEGFFMRHGHLRL